MKNSRNAGILSFNTSKPYKISIDGTLEEHTEIICKDINSSCEYAACDIEQLIIKAVTSIPEQKMKASKKSVQLLKEESEKDKSFYNNESPTDKEVMDQAKSLMFMVNVAGKPKMSDFLDLFTDFINAKVIECVGGLKMHKPIWDSLNISDKKMIMFKYLSFFVNPLAQLSDMAQSEGSPESSEVIKE